MYHVNPKTGEIGTCKAKSPETCPFGCENHSENLEEIQVKADKINKNKFKKPTEEELNDIIKQDKISGYDFSKLDSITQKYLFTKCKQFDNCKFSLKNKEIKDISFNQCYFVKTRKLSCDNTKFDKCYFSEELMDSKFNECEFDKSKFNNITINETEFAKIDGLGTKFNECEFDNVTLQDHVNFYRGQFNKCEFSNLHDDYGRFGPHSWTLNRFVETSFDKSNFKNVSLNCPVFSRAKINNCEFNNFTVKEGDFNDSHFDNIKFNNSSKLYKPDLDYTDWNNVDFDKTSELIQKKGM